MLARILKVAFLSAVMVLFVSVNSISYANSSNLLKQGMRNQEVYQLQTKLQEFGYYDDSVDGVFGFHTKMAVVYFQLDAGVTPDGVVGSETWEKLRNFHGTASSNRGNYSRTRGYPIASLALKQLGVGYSWGGTSPYGFDCSGFVYYIYAKNGISLPRMADEQFEVGMHIRKSDLELGDMVFFTTYEPGASHVGIYIGDNQFVHASSAAGKVVISSLSQPYYAERYLGARRL